MRRASGDRQGRGDGGRGRGRRDRRRVTGGRRVRALWHSGGVDRGPAAARGDRSGDGVEQLWCRRRRAGCAVGAQAHPPHRQLLCGREQGIRSPVSVRRARGGADPAGHPRRAAARRRRRHPGVLHAHRSRHPGCRRRTAVALRRRRRGGGGLAAERDPGVRRTNLCPRAGDPHRLRAGARLERRPARQPRLSGGRRQLQPGLRCGRPNHHRRGRAPGRTRRDLPRRGAHPGVFVHRVVHVPNPIKRIERETVRAS